MQTNMMVQTESQGHKMPELEGTSETTGHPSLIVTMIQIVNID